MYVDDNLFIRVTRPDSTVVTYTHFTDFNYSPVDLTDYFQVGVNQVEVRIENTSGPGEASAHWFAHLQPIAVTLPHQIIGDFPTSPIAKGSFLGRYFYIDYSGDGRLLLAANAEGQGIAKVTDKLIIQVWRPDGTMRRYTRDSTSLSVMDLTEYFQAGRNLVHFRLENNGSSAGSTPFWLVHLPTAPVNLPFQISSSIPTYSPADGDVFGRYFWVNVQQGQHHFLSSTGDGIGQLSVTGNFYLRVVHPDSSQVTFIQINATSNPVDISAYFEPGLNLVHARVRKSGSSVGIDTIYLTQSGIPIEQQPAQNPGWAIEITPGFPHAERGNGIFFFDQTFDLDYRQGEVILSQFANGQGTAYIDDILTVDITRPDQTVRSFSRSYAISPLDLTSMLQLGRNKVRVRLQEITSDSWSSALWFYNLALTSEALSFKVTDAIPVAERGNGIDYLVRQAYINYDGDGRLMLAAYSDGTENFYVDDILKLWIRHPDGTTRYTEYIYTQTPVDLTDYFAIGKNLVWFVMTETTSSSASTSLWLSQMRAASVTVPFRITAGFVAADRGNGYHYFGRSFFILSSGKNNTSLSQFADGTGNITADDQLIVDVYHPDGSHRGFVQSSITSSPINLDPYLNIGLNRVYVRLVETFSDSAASPIWVSQKAAPPPPTPASTPTFTLTPTATPTLCPTHAPIPVPGDCATITPTFTPTPTNTPAPTPTSTLGPTPTSTSPFKLYLPNVFNSLSSPTLNNPPNVPNSPSPTDGATGLGTAVTLRWAGGDPDGNRVTYDIYVNATTGEPTTLVAIDHANTFYNLNGLIPNTPYAWKIIVRDELGITTVGPIWRFVTAPVAPFQISLSTNSDKAYQLQKKGDGNGVSVGSKVYTDRNYTYATIPATLQEATYIMTSNDDKSKSDLSLVITVNRSIQVYVAHSDQQTAKPAWLSSFQDTGENLTFVDNENRMVVLSTFTAVFPAGDIVLGGNASGGTVNSMYSVIIKETTSMAE